jgi:cytochrome c oxidase subunit III
MALPTCAHNGPVANTQTADAFPAESLNPIAGPRLRGIPGRPDIVAVGTIIWLASELMFFAALFAAYFTIRNVTNAAAAPGSTSLWKYGHSLLDIPYAGVNTLILVASSVTCQLGVHAAEHMRASRAGNLFQVMKWGMREWYTLTFVMGAVFVSGQVWEYFNLFHEGLTLSSNAYGSLFFLATGFHALHVTGGLLAFLLLIGRTYMTRQFTREQLVNSIVVSYYWHFVDAIWVILFFVIYLLELIS